MLLHCVEYFGTFRYFYCTVESIPAWSCWPNRRCVSHLRTFPITLGADKTKCKTRIDTSSLSSALPARFLTTFRKVGNWIFTMSWGEGNRQIAVLLCSHLELQAAPFTGICSDFMKNALVFFLVFRIRSSERNNRNPDHTGDNQVLTPFSPRAVQGIVETNVKWGLNTTV